jgi:opacity protein-like surface antigen
MLMKKIVSTMILTAGITSSLMAEESHLYAGLDLISSDNRFTVEANGYKDKFSDDSNGFKLKIGAALFEGWRVQGYLLHETYDETLFDNYNDELNELGVDVIKSFALTPEFSPFVQLGLGFGQMDLDGYYDDSIAEVSIKLGGGIMYKVTPQFELLAGLDIQGRGWEDIVIGSTTVETSESSRKLYVGFNIHF